MWLGDSLLKNRYMRQYRMSIGKLMTNLNMVSWYNGKFQRKVWNLLFFSVAWSIWLMRNNLFFKVIRSNKFHIH